VQEQWCGVWALQEAGCGVSLHVELKECRPVFQREFQALLRICFWQKVREERNWTGAEGVKGGCYYF